MKRLLLFSLAYLFCSTQMQLLAQCSSSTLNWDYLQFFPSNGIGTYTTLSQSQTQTFAFGSQLVTLTHNYTGSNAIGVNATNTAAGASYGSDSDVEFLGNGTIGLQFQAAVQNLKFSIYDIDASQQVTVKAFNNGTPVNVSMVKLSGSILTVTGSNTTNTQVVATNNSVVVDNSTDGAVNIDVVGPLTNVSITVSNSGLGGCNNGGKGCTEFGNFWLSDIQACYTSVFPSNYHQTAYMQPFTGMPDYFITTPDNNSAYMLDPVTGKAKWLFTDNAYDYINSFAYDGVNKVLYYIAERSTPDATIKTLKRYDFNSNTSFTVGNVTSLYGIPTFDQGVQSSGACFYDGALYLGIEGGNDSKSIIWRIDLKTTPVQVAQVFAVNSSEGGTSVHDWGDFIIKNGVLIDFNTARTGTSPSFTYPNSSYIHYNLISGSTSTFKNPAAASPYVGQAGMGWSGNLYSVRNTVERYLENGSRGAAVAITSISGPAWVGNSGDASEPFRPKMDFGDAPSAYEPDPLSPAVHELDANLRLGTFADVEWVKSPSTTSYVSANEDGTDEDGMAFANLLTGASTYSAQVSVYNNTGSPATLIAWLDYNKNNVFDASEAVTVSVASNASQQNISLLWNGVTNTLPNLSKTYLRIRITAQANGMTALNPTGYFANGEVEDYLVTVDKVVLAADDFRFEAKQTNDKVQLTWSGASGKWKRYVVERSKDATNWQTLGDVASGVTAPAMYTDQMPLHGRSFYRLQLWTSEGVLHYSDVRSVLMMGTSGLQVVPNPVAQKGAVWINAAHSCKISLRIYDIVGNLVATIACELNPGVNKVELPQVHTFKKGRYIVVADLPAGPQKSVFVKE